MNRFLVALFSPALLATAACDENPDTPPLGAFTVTATATSTINGFTTKDGWNVKYTKFIVSFASAKVSSSDGVLAADEGPQLADLATPGPVALVKQRNRVARAWQRVSFEIAPPPADTVTSSSLSDADKAAIAGASIYVAGTMTKDAVTKQLAFALAPDTTYASCTAPVNGAPLPGLVVVKNGTDSADIGIATEALFSDASGSLATLRGNAIANADQNDDGTVDLGELQQTTLDAARNETASYNAPTITTVAQFLTEQARAIVTTWRGNGTCTATPVTAAP